MCGGDAAHRRERWVAVRGRIRGLAKIIRSYCSNITSLYYLMGGGETTRRGGARGGLSPWSGDCGEPAPSQKGFGGPLNSLNLTAKITIVGLQLHFGWAHAHPGNRISYLKILARYLKFHFWLDSSCYEKRLFSELRTSHMNPYLKAVGCVIHGKLRVSRKTTWFTQNYVIHAAPVETT